jgi:exodeoxyribonuclease-3
LRLLRFNARAKGVGWRLDYFLCSPQLADKAHETFMLPDIQGSDHVPLGLSLYK